MEREEERESKLLATSITKRKIKDRTGGRTSKIDM